MEKFITATGKTIDLAIEAGLTDAGMPEGWLDSIISSFSSLEEDISSEAPEDELIKLEPAA